MYGRAAFAKGQGLSSGLMCRGAAVCRGRGEGGIWEEGCIQVGLCGGVVV